MATKLLLPTNGVKKAVYLGKPITEIIINGFFTVDQHWTVIYWNKAAETILGVPAVDIVGKNLWKEFAGVFPQIFIQPINDRAHIIFPLCEIIV